MTCDHFPVTLFDLPCANSACTRENVIRIRWEAYPPIAPPRGDVIFVSKDYAPAVRYFRRILWSSDYGRKRWFEWEGMP